MRVVGCFVWYQNNILLLQRHPQKPEPYTWGLPAGKVEKGESDIDAICREIQEETGQHISPQTLEHLAEMPFSGPGGSGDFVIYRHESMQPFNVSIDPHAHIAYKWVSPDDILNYPLISGLDKVIIMLGYAKRL